MLCKKHAAPPCGLGRRSLERPAVALAKADDARRWSCDHRCRASPPQEHAILADNVARADRANRDVAGDPVGRYRFDRAHGVAEVTFGRQCPASQT